MKQIDTNMENAIDDTLDYIIDLIGESANQEKIKEFIDLHVNDYVRERNENLDYEVVFTDDECEQIIEETVKRYKEL